MNEETTPTEELKSLPAQNWGDPDGDGILADMARVFDAPAKETPVKETPKAGAPPVEEPAKKEPAKKEDEAPLEDEDFFKEDEPEKPKEEEKPDDFDAETEKLAEGMEVKAFAKFKELRAQLKEAKTKTVSPEVEAKLQELELKAKEVAGLTERLEVLSNVSAKVKMEQSPEYRTQILEPAADLFDSMDKLSEMYEIDPSVIRAILRVSDRKEQNALIDKHLGDFSDFDRSEVYRSIQDFNALSRSRERMLESAEAKLGEFEARRAEQEIQAKESDRKNQQLIQKAIWDKYQSIIPGLLDDDDEPTPAMERLMARGFSVDFDKAKPKDKAFAAFSGVLLPHLVNEVKALKEKLEAYEKEDKKQTKRLAKVGEGIAQGDVKTGTGETGDFMAEFLSKKF